MNKFFYFQILKRFDKVFFNYLCFPTLKVKLTTSFLVEQTQNLRQI